MRASLPIVSALACACAAAACLFPSLDGLSNAKDAAAGDVGVDAVSDAQGVQSFCSTSTARFCDDFDDSDGGAFTKWTTQTAQDGVTLAREVSDASAPFGVRFVQTAIDASSPHAALQSDFNAPINTSAHVAFDLRVDEYPAFGDLKPIVTLQLDGSLWPNTDDCVGLALQQSTSQLFECVPVDGGGSTYPRHTLAKSPQLGKWTHVDLTLTFAPGNISLTVAFDGATVLGPTTLDARITYASPALQIGMVSMDPRSSANVLMDNVTFDWQ
jgi:hypothetical protein